MSFNNDIIITAMDRFVWFVLLVVFSHLVTEFTRVTGYTRGTRHDSVMVNDSLIQPIRVQNQIQYPGQEYGHYDRPDPPYYSGNSHFNSYNNNNKQIRDGNSNANNNNNNMFSNFISGLFSQNDNSNNNHNNNNANSNGQEFPETNANVDTQSGDVRTFGFVQPIIDSIFEIPISTLRAVNNLVGRLTFSYRQQQQQQQQPPQQQQGFNTHLLPQQQQQHQYSPSQPSYYGMPRSATIQPKSEFEMFEKDTPNRQQPQQQ